RMRNGFESARDAGVSLAFFAADASEVQVRFEPSAGGVANRVVVCYKDAVLDPVQGPTTTTKWRLPPVNRPEQTMRGVQVVSMVNGGNANFVVANSSHWIYAGTGFKDGDSVPGIVGYEMDSFQSSYPGPNSTSFTLLSSSPFTDYAGVPQVSNSSIYLAPSGAWVWSSGTISWSWGLDGFWHQRNDVRIQQTSVNLLNAFINGAPLDNLFMTVPTTAVAGQPFTIDVTAADSLGNPIAQYGGTVHFSSSATSAVLPPNSTLTNGQGSFSATLTKAGSQTIVATDTVTAAITGTLALNVRGTAASLDVVVPATAKAGTAFSVAVTAKNSDGTTATG